jgi:hypothetical protein
VKSCEVKIGGFGGQGVILMGIIIGKAAAIYDEGHATLTQAFGPEARGSSLAPSSSSTPAISPPRGTDVMILSQEAYAKFAPDGRGGVDPGGELASRGRPAGRQEFCIPRPIAEDLGRNSPEHRWWASSAVTGWRGGGPPGGQVRGAAETEDQSGLTFDRRRQAQLGSGLGARERKERAWLATWVNRVGKPLAGAGNRRREVSLAGHGDPGPHRWAFPLPCSLPPGVDIGAMWGRRPGQVSRSGRSRAGALPLARHLRPGLHASL